MESKYGFTKLTVAEFKEWIESIKIARTILKIQQHHTYNPSYINFKGSNHFELQKGMKAYHVTYNGWNDIGQHFTIFPDGLILTGRSLEKSPACIYGQNANAICIENLGNFDLGGDQMSDEQRNAILEVTAILCQRFSLQVDTDRVVYHHWFDLASGERNNGTKNNKTCPGSNFFGGNKVSDCETYFIPEIKSRINTISKPINNTSGSILKYVVVTSKTLNIRVLPDYQSSKVKDRAPALYGGVLRVYNVMGNWYKISNSAEQWVNGRYTKDVKRATVLASTLNVRSGPGVDYPKIGSFKKGEEVFISEIEMEWCKINLENKWVSKKYLRLEE